MLTVLILIRAIKKKGKMMMTGTVINWEAFTIRLVIEFLGRNGINAEKMSLLVRDCSCGNQRWLLILLDLNSVIYYVVGYIRIIEGDAENLVEH